MTVLNIYTSALNNLAYKKYNKLLQKFL